MRLKEAQLLGILALITIGIILLSMLRGGGEGEEVARLREDGRSARVDPQGLDDWLGLQDETQERRDTTPYRGAGGTLDIEGDQAAETGDEPERRAEEDADRAISRELQDNEPEDIPLRPREPAPVPIPPEELSTGPKIHIVQKGDTLSAISRKYYNIASKWRIILEANGDLIGKPEDLRPEMQLVIPELDLTQLSPAGSGRQAAPLSARAAVPGARYYDVKKGDTLWVIAENAYGDGTAWVNIQKANSDLIQEPEDLRPGMRLILP